MTQAMFEFICARADAAKDAAMRLRNGASERCADLLAIADSGHALEEAATILAGQESPPCEWVAGPRQYVVIPEEPQENP